MTDTAAPTPPARNPARPIALIVLLILILMAALYALSDRFAPASSRGQVTANVIQIAPRVSGEVVDVMVLDDSFVKAGTPLFRIDPRPLELAVQQAEASLDTASQGVSASSASLVAAQAAVTQARTNLEAVTTEVERTLALERRGIASKAQGDKARAQMADAEAQVSGAEAKLKSAQAQLGPEGTENPAILGAQAQLERAQYDLASSIVKAPHDGVVTNVTLAEGQFIGAGNPALTFIDASAAWVTVDMRENQLQLIGGGDEVGLVFDAVPGQVFEGRVQSIAWGINSGRNAQGGLVVNQQSNRWFEPARRIPVRIELNGGMEAWPLKARVGGKVHALIYAEGRGNPIAILGTAMQRVRAWLTYLH